MLSHSRRPPLKAYCHLNSFCLSLLDRPFPFSSSFCHFIYCFTLLFIIHSSGAMGFIHRVKQCVRSVARALTGSQGHRKTLTHAHVQRGGKGSLTSPMVEVQNPPFFPSLVSTLHFSLAPAVPQSNLRLHAKCPGPYLTNGSREKSERRKNET